MSERVGRGNPSGFILRFMYDSISSPAELGIVRIDDLAWIRPMHSCLAQHALTGSMLIIG